MLVAVCVHTVNNDDDVVVALQIEDHLCNKRFWQKYRRKGLIKVIKSCSSFNRHRWFILYTYAEKQGFLFVSLFIFYPHFLLLFHLLFLLLLLIVVSF